MESFDSMSDEESFLNDDGEEVLPLDFDFEFTNHFEGDDGLLSSEGVVSSNDTGDVTVNSPDETGK